MSCFLFLRVTNRTISFLCHLLQCYLTQKSVPEPRPAGSQHICWKPLWASQSCDSCHYKNTHLDIIHDRTLPHTQCCGGVDLRKWDITQEPTGPLQTLKSIRHTHSELRAAADETYECVWRNRRIWTVQCVSYSVLCCSRHSIDTHPWKSCSSAGTSLALWKTRSRDFTWKMRSVTMVHSVVARLLSIKEKLQWLLKGIVHPKMNFLWLFIHPQVVPNLYEFLLPDKHKRRYFKECEKLNSFKEFGISKVPHDNIFILLNYPFKTAIHISIIIVLLFWNYYYYCIVLENIL